MAQHTTGRRNDLVNQADDPRHTYSDVLSQHTAEGTFVMSQDIPDGRSCG